MNTFVLLVNAVWTLVFLSLLLTHCHGFTNVAGKTCEPVDEHGCKCLLTDDSKKIVDLTSYGNTDSTPRFKDVQGSNGHTYSYNPCNGFELNGCRNASMCVSEDGTYQQIADAGSTQFQYNKQDGSILAAYHTHTSIIKASIVKLICDHSACDPVFTPEGESTGGVYNFELTSVCSCPGMCDANGPIDECKQSDSSGAGRLGLVALVVFGLLTVAIIIAGLCMQIVGRESRWGIPCKKT